MECRTAPSGGSLQPALPLAGRKLVKSIEIIILLHCRWGFLNFRFANIVLAAVPLKKVKSLENNACFML